MNRKRTNQAVKNPAWSTLNDRQLRQVEGGDYVPTDTLTLNFEEIKHDYNPQQASPTARPQCYLKYTLVR